MNKRGEKIVQVSGFGVANSSNTQCDYLIVALTKNGRVIISRGDGQWADISPKLEADDE